MAQSTQAVKRRIKSVRSTMKITNAMELVAASKLMRQKNRMEKNKEYANTLADTVQKILSQVQDDENKFLLVRKATNPLTIVFTSDTGLCGGYNANIFKLVQNTCSSSEPIIMIGHKGMNWIKNRDFNCIKTYGDFDSATHLDTNVVANEAMQLYLKNEVSEIRIIYTEFENSITFVPQVKTLLPITKEERAKDNKEILFEPNSTQVIDKIVPMYINSLFYSFFLRAKTSEQASRRMAMQTATDNADNLCNDLTLEYNQARQGAITQEITEIVAGSGS